MSDLRFWDTGAAHPKNPCMASVLPDGIKSLGGGLTVQHFTLTHEQARWNAVFNSDRRLGRGILSPDVTYAKLIDLGAGVLWMSDTPDERRDHRPILTEAKGHTLIAGLGLGFVTLGCSRIPAVSRITVLEKDQRVIDLVLPHLEKHFLCPVRVLCADVFTWKPDPGVLFDAVWLDIWPTLNTDDLAEHGKLKRRYRRFCPAPGLVEAWGNRLLKRVAAQEREEARNNTALWALVGGRNPMFTDLEAP